MRFFLCHPTTSSIVNLCLASLLSLQSIVSDWRAIVHCALSPSTHSGLTHKHSAPGAWKQTHPPLALRLMTSRWVDPPPLPAALGLWMRERQLALKTWTDIQEAHQALEDAQRLAEEAEMAARANRFLPPGPFCRQDRSPIVASNTLCKLYVHAHLPFVRRIAASTLHDSLGP